ncbi:hypothetical protein ABZV29_08600 [Streptomyces sp. NPDC005236]|uniref:hypothetical protein n=1 Tax=Streptomyces sp. NPDC005236 TaxID=3157028 RepID=UPI0033A4F512
MDQERYVAEPNQELHPGKYRRERYNDTNGAVYETTHYDAHGNAFTQNHQLGPAERYGYTYVGASAPRAHAQPRVQPAVGAAAAAAAVGGAEAYYEIADNHVQQNASTDGEDDGLAALWMIIIVVLLALGPLFLGIWMIRRAKEAGKTATHGRFVLLLEIPWLATLRVWLFDGGTTAWATAVTTPVALAVWYGLTLRDEARWRREDAELA